MFHNTLIDKMFEHLRPQTNLVAVRLGKLHIVCDQDIAAAFQTNVFGKNILTLCNAIKRVEAAINIRKTTALVGVKNIYDFHVLNLYVLLRDHIFPDLMQQKEAYRYLIDFIRNNTSWDRHMINKYTTVLPLLRDYPRLLLGDWSISQFYMLGAAEIRSVIEASPAMRDYWGQRISCRINFKRSSFRELASEAGCAPFEPSWPAADNFMWCSLVQRSDKVELCNYKQHLVRLMPLLRTQKKGLIYGSLPDTINSDRSSGISEFVNSKLAELWGTVFSGETRKRKRVSFNGEPLRPLCTHSTSKNENEANELF